MNKISIQVISDIHLELLDEIPKFSPQAEYLFLAGDIGTLDNNCIKKFEEFLSYCSKNWLKVFFVFGNHEFHQNNLKIDEKICFENLEEEYGKFFSKYSNIYLLNNSYIEILPNLNIYGTTLWTGNYGMMEDENNKLELGKYFNDYNMITTKSIDPKMNKLINNNFMDDLSLKQLELLKNHLITTDKKTIIMTHFPPFNNGSRNPKYTIQEDFVTNYFAWNEIYKTLNMTNVICWISGHTHWSYDIIKDGVKFISNQYGHIKKYKTNISGFDSSKIFEFEYQSKN